METNTPTPVKLDRGIHVMHLFYTLERPEWSSLDSAESNQAKASLEALCQRNAHPCAPRLVVYANLGGKADMAFMLFSREADELGRMHHELEACFPPGSLRRVYSYLSVTELSEYASTEEDFKRMIEHQEKLDPASPEFAARLEAMTKKSEEYGNYRLYPEMPDWEIMCFYPMNKSRAVGANWYALDFAERKKLMAGHARVGRTFAGRVAQLITGSTGLDDWEWGVTLMAHQLDAIKQIVYEMRFDEVSAAYAEFGPFYINLRMPVPALWEHLKL